MTLDKPLDKILFFDIETVSEFETLKELEEKKPKLHKIFFDYIDFFKRRYPEDGDITPEERYFKRAALVPEFSRVVAASFCFYDTKGELHRTTFSNHDEVELLKEIRTLFNRIERLDFYMCGHNIKLFDIPTLGKRFVINDMKPPKIFPIYNTKPWEVKAIDTKDLWNYNNPYSIGSLDLLCVSMGIESPKEMEVSGENLNEFYYKTKKLDVISEYCEKDTVALAHIIKKIFELK